MGAGAQMLRGLADAARAVRAMPGRAWHWLRDHAAHAVALAWLGGMAVFGTTTVVRAIAVRRADAALAPAPVVAAAIPVPASEEVLAMPDVDQLDALRKARFHANGLAAAGEEGEPSPEDIAAARSQVAQGFAAEGERVGTSGNVVIVTAGGIASWVKRNKGKKPDPETLAWLRADEAEHGMGPYAGWADRSDGDVLAYAKEQHHAQKVAAAAVANPTAGPAEPAADPAPPVTSSAAPATVASAPLDSGRERAEAAPRPSGPPISLVRLGAAAVAGLDARAASTARPRVPTATDLDEVRQQVRDLGPAGTVTVVLRDDTLVVSAIAERLFASPERVTLSSEGEHIVRALGRALAAHPGRAYRITTSAERALELAGNLVISGVDADRLEVTLAPIDPAVDVIEIAILPAALVGLP